MPPLLHNLPAETADDVLSFMEPRDVYALMALSTIDRAHYRTPHFFRLVVLYTLHDRARALSRAPKPLSAEAIAAMSFRELRAAATARDINVKESITKPTQLLLKLAIPSPFSSKPVLRAVLEKWSEAVSGRPGFDTPHPSFSSCHRSCAAPVLGLSSVNPASPIWEHAAELLMIGDWDEWTDFESFESYKKDVSAALSRIFKLTLCDALTNQHAGGAFLLPWARLVPERAAPKRALFDGPGLFLPMSGQMLPTYLDGAAIKLLHDAATPVCDDGNSFSSLDRAHFAITSSSWLRSVTDDSLSSVLSEATQTIAPHASRSDVCAVASEIIILQKGDSIASFSPAAASAPGALATLFVDLPTDCIDCIGQHTKKKVKARKTGKVRDVLPSLPVLQGGDLLATGDPSRVGGRSIRADGSAATTKSLARSLGCPVLARGGLATDPNEAHGTLFSWLAVAAGKPVAVTPVTSGCKVILVFTLHHKDPPKFKRPKSRPPPIEYDDAVVVLHHLLPVACGNSKPRGAQVNVSYSHTGNARYACSNNWGDTDAMRAADPLTLFQIRAYSYDSHGCDICFPAPSLSPLTPFDLNEFGDLKTFALVGNDLLRGKDLALFELLKDAIGGEACKGDEAAKMVGWIGERNSGTGVWSDIASQLGGAGGIEALLAEDADRYIPTSTSSGLSVIGSCAVAKGWNEGSAIVDWGILEEGWMSFSDMDEGPELMVEVNVSVEDSLRNIKPEIVNGGYDEVWLIAVRRVPTITVQWTTE
ncbi:hypothetical protein TeGR_g2231 [Tetraparma gracilis]|uniref:F-box domain-containing protein n=1 Tax=Tetraparma gracilis TaxID=2962635 RepID=A0ABQ6MAM5_9STRA|nr:hypothetical protein TeGR_g2231 [Tetraparma gracilis]